MNRVEVYGFGSFFFDHSYKRDVDLLLIHCDIGTESCAFAILCKQLLKRIGHNCHITMLSRTEELDLDFIARSKARKLGTIEMSSMEDDAAALMPWITC